MTDSSNEYVQDRLKDTETVIEGLKKVFTMLKKDFPEAVDLHTYIQQGAACIQYLGKQSKEKAS